MKDYANAANREADAHVENMPRGMQAEGLTGRLACAEFASNPAGNGPCVRQRF